jgi:hypothetical protein
MAVLFFTLFQLLSLYMYIRWFHVLYKKVRRYIKLIMQAGNCAAEGGDGAYYGRKKGN